MKFTIILLMFFLAGCFFSHPDKEAVSKQELLKYIRQKDNGLLKEQQVNEIRVALQYHPSSLLVAQDLSIADANNKAVIDSLERKYSDNYYFLLKFSKKGKEAIRQLGSFERYSDMVSVLSFELSRFVNLTTPQKDTIDLSDYFFDQTYGTSDGNTVLLVFSKQKLKNKSALQINVAECGLGTGNLKFSFKKQDLENIPQIKYTN